MDLGFIVFAGLGLFALHWYLKGSALSKEKELRRSLELCFTRDEQYNITREMYRRNLEVPKVLPPLLGKTDESTANKKNDTYFVQEVGTGKLVRLYTEDDIDEEYDERIKNGTGTTLNPGMYSIQVAPIETYKSGKDKGGVKIFKGSSDSSTRTKI